MSLICGLKALAMMERISPKNKLDVAPALKIVINANFNLGDYQKAIEYGIQLQSLYPADHPDFTALVRAIGQAFINQGELQRAINWWKLSLKRL